MNYNRGTSLTKPGILHPFNCSYSSLCVLVFHFGFNLCFTDFEEVWTICLHRLLRQHVFRSIVPLFSWFFSSSCLAHFLSLSVFIVIIHSSLLSDHPSLTLLVFLAPFYINLFLLFLHTPFLSACFSKWHHFFKKCSIYDFHIVILSCFTALSME